MKLLIAFTLLTVSLCAGLCCTPEDEYNNDTFIIRNDTIISIQNNQTNFNIDDYIYIETTIDKQQHTIDDQSITLTDFDYGEVNESSIRNNLSLYKITEYNTTVQIPLLNEHITTIEGEYYLDENYNNSTIRFDNYFDGNQYKSIIGIKLLETGTFYLANTYEYNDTFVYFDGGTYENGYIQIKSKIINSNEEGQYYFNVN